MEEFNVYARERDHQNALREGSRINLRFKKVVPPDALTPEGLRRYLEPWIDFDANAAASPREGREGREGGGLRKGMHRREVDDLLGRARREAACKGGELDCIVAIYKDDEGDLELIFVEDVLIRIGPER